MSCILDCCLGCRCFLGEGMTEKSRNALYNALIKKRESQGLNELEVYVLKDINNKKLAQHPSSSIKPLPDVTAKNTRETLTNDILDSIKAETRANPHKPLDSKELTILPLDIQKRLEEYRVQCLNQEFLQEVLEKLKMNQKPYEQLLTSEELQLLEKIKTLSEKSQENAILLAEISKENTKLTLQNHHLSFPEFMEEYLRFIKRYQKIISS